MLMAVIDFRLPRQTRWVFAWSNWDVLSVLAAFAHLGFIVWLVVGFSARPWWGNLICACLYSIGMSWNINGVSHNFLHTPYFRWKQLNYAFSLLESVTIGFSQTFYTWVHLRHHEGNSDHDVVLSFSWGLAPWSKAVQRALPEPNTHKLVVGLGDAPSNACMSGR